MLKKLPHLWRSYAHLVDSLGIVAILFSHPETMQLTCMMMSSKESI